MPNDLRIARVGAVRTALVLVLAGGVLAPGAVRAEQQHVVRIGQSLGLIAKQYGTSVTSLAAVNSLKPDGILREGQVLKVPGSGSIEVSAGQSLSKIARDYHVSVTALAAANGLDREATLQLGQKLRLPDGATPPKQVAAATTAAPAPAAPRTTAAPARIVPSAAPPAAGVSVAAAAKPAASQGAKTTTPEKPGKSSKWPWGKPKQPGVVELFRIGSKESVRLKLVDSRGRPRQDARRALREFLRPRDSKRRKTPNPRLLSLLARVSDHFGGRPLHIVSGYRIAKGLTRKTSRHVAGEAIDFRIPGVPLTVLRDYCQQLDEVGVGYYPTTEFVHLDVRKQPARWTDWSLPGQPPVLVKPIESDDDGKDEIVAPPMPEEKTAGRKSRDESIRNADAPTG
jgi:uncharacterized protein YcbK (DUF882 family)